jgi:hypothetical protein
MVDFRAFLEGATCSAIHSAAKSKFSDKLYSSTYTIMTGQQAKLETGTCRMLL